jgi:hypothetical protein
MRMVDEDSDAIPLTPRDFGSIISVRLADLFDFSQTAWQSYSTGTLEDEEQLVSNMDIPGERNLETELDPIVQDILYR